MSLQELIDEAKRIDAANDVIDTYIKRPTGEEYIAQKIAEIRKIIEKYSCADDVEKISKYAGIDLEFALAVKYALLQEQYNEKTDEEKAEWQEKTNNRVPGQEYVFLVGTQGKGDKLNTYEAEKLLEHMRKTNGKITTEDMKKLFGKDTHNDYLALLELSYRLSMNGDTLEDAAAAWNAKKGQEMITALEYMLITALMGYMSNQNSSSGPNSIVKEPTTGKPINNGGSSNEGKLPTNDSQLKHIFRDKNGHLPDTPQNRSLLEHTTKKENFLGVDKYGNNWYAKKQPDGSQVWVETRNGNIINGGLNSTPKNWNSQTGLKANQSP